MNIVNLPENILENILSYIIKSVIHKIKYYFEINNYNDFVEYKSDIQYIKKLYNMFKIQIPYQINKIIYDSIIIELKYTKHCYFCLLEYYKNDNDLQYDLSVGDINTDIGFYPFQNIRFIHYEGIKYKKYKNDLHKLFLNNTLFNIHKKYKSIMFTSDTIEIIENNTMKTYKICYKYKYISKLIQ